MKKVLVVDDEKLIVKGLKFSLEQDDMEVDTAFDGEEAVNKARANSYDIILLDIMLHAFLLTLSGIPVIYSGDEIAYNKNIAFMEKDTIDWGRTGKDYRDLIGNLSQVKSQHPALYSDNTGDGFEILNLDNKNVFAFKRVAGDDELICIFNMSKREQKDIDLSSVLTGEEEVVFFGKMDTYNTAGELPTGVYTFSPWEFYIIATK